jgi:hypothetical protein
MDAKRFDDTTKMLSHSDSRRTALKGLAGMAAGGALMLPFARGTSAAPKHCGNCSSHDECGNGRCRAWQGQNYCCTGFWSRGDCYNPKPKSKIWSYRWKDGELYYYNRNTKRFRLARLFCFTGVL